jgi:hypothetical protein
LQGGELEPGIAVLRFNASLNAGNMPPGAWVLIYCTGGALQITPGTASNQATTVGQVQTGSLTSAVAAGTANALTATIASSLTGLTNNQRITLTAAAANAGAATLALTLGSTALPSFPIVKGNDQPLAAGDIPGAGYPIDLDWSAGFGAFVMQNPATGIEANAVAQIQSLTASVAANALTGTLAPNTLSFRNPVLSNGMPVSAQIAAPLPLTIPSGATLGTVSGQQARLVWLVAYNGGTPVLCVVNLSGGLNLDETTLISPTTISATATAANVIYSASAVSAGSPFRVVGFTDIVEATAGTWATGPTTVQGSGGEALAAMSSIGYGQTWQNTTSVRTYNTTYYNTSGKPRMVVVNAGLMGTGQNFNDLFVNGLAVAYMSQNTAGLNTGIWCPLTAIVPPGASYNLNGNGSITSWFELG